MPESFGARLRQQREDRQIDLIAISEQTKIKLSLLEALERGDVSHWPSGIFRRAYIRAYAQFIGLDPDTVLREFLEVHPDPGDAFVATVAGAAAAEEEYAKTAGSLRFRNIVDTALGSLTRLRRPVLAGKRPPSEAPTVPAVIEIPAARQADTRVWMQVEESAAEPCRDDMVQQPAEVPVALETPQASIAPSASEPVEPLPRDSAPLLDSPSPVLERREEAPPLTMQTTPTVTSTDSEAAREARLEAVAHLCTELGRVVERDAVRQLLQESAAVLTATGLIVWLWDDIVEALRPGLVHGYSDRVLAHLPAVAPDADNATAAAFRTQTACEVAASAHASAALVVPLLIPDGCAGVLAIELQQGVQPTRSLRAIAAVLAAALTQLVHRSRPADRPGHVERMATAVAQFRPAARPMKVRR